MNYYQNELMDHNGKSEIFRINKHVYFNSLGHYLTLNNSKIFLSLTESRILYYLVNNANIRIPAADIIKYLEHYSAGLYTEQNEATEKVY